MRRLCLTGIFITSTLPTINSTSTLSTWLGKFLEKINYSRLTSHILIRRNKTSKQASKVFSKTVSRDPVERIVSNYFYVRSPARWRGREVSPSQAWFLKNIHDCVRSDDIECQAVMVLSHLTVQIRLRPLFCSEEFGYGFETPVGLQISYIEAR